MLENTMFYVIFVSQIVLISLYVPQKIIRRLEQVSSRYPADEYPKLYPNGVNYYQKAKGWFTWLTRIIFVLGFVVAWLIYKAAEVNEGQINQMYPWAYFMLQMLPVMLLEQTTFKHYRHMRKADTRTSRKAELAPRKLFSFVSPMLFWSAVLAYLLFVLFAFAVHGFSLEETSMPLEMSAVVLLGNLFFAGIVAFLLRGKKLDPYQTQLDRMRTIEYNIKWLFYISIAVSLFAIVQVAMDKFDMKFIEPVLMSVYCQLIVVPGVLLQLNKIRLEDLDFDVYKQEVSSR